MTDIAVDSSTLVDYLAGEKGRDVQYLQEMILGQNAYLPPAVVTEILSFIGISSIMINKINRLPLLSVETGYWQRAGEMRRKLLAKKLKAKTTDALIAQSCIDHDIPLLTRDDDFHHYAEHCGLKLALS